MKCKDCEHWIPWNCGHVGDCRVGGTDRLVIRGIDRGIKSTCRNDECHIRDWQNIETTERIEYKGW